MDATELVIRFTAGYYRDFLAGPTTGSGTTSSLTHTTQRLYGFIITDLLINRIIA